MRTVLVSLVVLAVAVPAFAAELDLDPSTVVLQKSDVPAGFTLDRKASGVRSNESEAKDEPPFRALFVRWGRVTGYEVEFDRKSASIGSRADILRTPAGARAMYDWFGLEVRKIGIRGFQRGQVRIGDEGLLYRSRTPASFTIVMWRSGRVFAGVGSTGVSTERTVALARAQQRRMAAALR